MGKKILPCLFFAVCCNALLSCSRPSLTPHYRDSVFDTALVLVNSGKRDQAISIVNRHYAGFPALSIMDRFRYYQFLHDLNNAYYSGAYHPLKALDYADSMVWLLKTNDLTAKLPAEYALASNLQGQLYVDMQRFPEAFSTFGLCRYLAEKAGDSCLVAKYNSAMGTVRFWQGQYPEAIGLLKHSLSRESSCKEDAAEYHDFQKTLNTIGLVYTKMGRNDSAMAYYHKAVDYLIQKRRLYTTDSIFPEISLGVVYGNEAATLQDAGDFSGAEMMFKNGIAVNCVPGRDERSCLVDQIRLAQVYLQTSRNAMAADLLGETGNRLKSVDDGTKKLWFTLMSQCQAAAGNEKQAIAYLQSALTLSDSIAVKVQHQYATNEDNIYQLVEAKYTIDLLQKNSTIQQMSLIIGGMLFFMAVTFTLLIRKNLKRHKQMLAALGQKNKEKDRILQVVAHDLRSPIGGIKMLSGLILGKDEAKQAELLSFIRNGATNCLDLVNELLKENFYGDGVILDKTAFDLTQLVAESAQLMQFNADEKAQVIKTTLPKDKQLILADAGKIGRVLGNLIGNAIKFSRQGDEILISLSENGQYYRITIRDYGIGIPAGEKDQVFDAFTLSRRPGTEGERSFGFGLSISKQIVEAHGGRIGFASREGQGSEFFIDLPMIDAAP
jgi:signal transduction histidine kinase